MFSTLTLFCHVVSLWINVYFRAFIAWEDKVCIDPDQEHAERKNLADYKGRLVFGETVLPDPFSLDSGWFGESNCCMWPNVYFWDIANYLRMKTAAELYHRLCNEYKQGKAYRYISQLNKIMYMYTWKCTWSIISSHQVPNTYKCYVTWFHWDLGSSNLYSYIICLLPWLQCTWP